MSKSDNKVHATKPTREVARKVKRFLEETTTDTYKIVQEVYTLSTTKRVR